jgi:hypothetical protein
MRKIFYFDCHISVFREYEYVASKLLTDYKMEGWLISNHTHLLSREIDTVQVVNQDSWPHLNQSMIEDFRAIYDDYLKGFDVFFVGYPTSFALLFAHLCKPIIVSNCVRYDMPFCWSKDLSMLNRLHDSLGELHGRGLLEVVSNNLADHDYFMLSPHGVPSTLIPTIGAYAQLRWNPRNEHSLLYTGETRFPRSSHLARRTELGWFLNDRLCEFASITHMPYEVSTMSMAEHYAGGIPLLFPCEIFLRNSWQQEERMLQSRYWCHGGRTEYPLYLRHCHEGNYHSWWTTRADFFHQLSQVNYFESVEHLEYITRPGLGLPLNRPHRQHLIDREASLLGCWRAVFERIGLR